MTYRGTASLSFGAMRFYPACLSYILRYKKRLSDVLSTEKKTGTIELIDEGLVKYYMPLENFKEFYLTKNPQPAVMNDNKYTNIYFKKNA
jgi:hypothetical protein